MERENELAENGGSRANHAFSVLKVDAGQILNTNAVGFNLRRKLSDGVSFPSIRSALVPMPNSGKML